MLTFLLFTLINLCIGYATAVLLGHGPSPWYAIFLPAGNDVVQIDVLDPEVDEPTDRSSVAAEEEEEPTASAMPATVSYPFPEMNEPEDREPHPEASEPELQGATDPVDEEQEPPLDDDDDSEEDDETEDIEKYLAAGRAEAAAKAAAELAAAEIEAAEIDAAGDDETAADNEEAEDQGLSDDEIAAMFTAQAEDSVEPNDDDPAEQESAASEDTLEDSAEAEPADTLDQNDIAALFNQT